MLGKVNEVPNFLRNLTPNVWGHFSSSARKKGESIPQKSVCVCVCVKNDACVFVVNYGYLFIFLGVLCRLLWEPKTL